MSPRRIAVCLEVNPKQTFASALDWPGWCRAGRDESAALEALASCAQRYAPVAGHAGVTFPPMAAFDVVERLPGGPATAFAAPECRRPFPQMTAEAERAKVTPAAARRLAGLVTTTWATFDEVAGLAGFAGFLIGARALQGFGAARVPPAALSILAVTFEECAERNRALGLFGATAGISASVGVIASGFLTAGPGWRWVFFINVPVGVLLVAMAAIFLPVDSPSRRRSERFDVAGAVTVTGGLLLLVYAFSCSANYGWSSVSTLGLLAASVVLLSAFMAIEARSRSPLVPRVAVRNRTLVAANFSAFFLFGGFFSFIFVGSLLMQDVLGYSPTRTGVAWLATTGTSFFAAAIAGAKLVGMVGVRRLLVAGFSLLAIAALLLTRIPAGAHYTTDLLPALVLVGMAGGLSAPAIQIGALSGVSHSLTGLAGGLVETLREIGGGIGVAVVATVLASRAGNLAGAAKSANHQLEAVNAFRSAFWVMFIAGALGVLAAATLFPRGVAPDIELDQAPSSESFSLEVVEH